MKRGTFLITIFMIALFQNSVSASVGFSMGGDMFSIVAKTTMVSMVRETRAIYKRGMSESAFIEAALEEIPGDRRSEQLTGYFRQVYEYHKSGISESEVFDRENGRTLNEILSLAKERGSATKAMFKNENDPGVKAFKPFKWWLKLIVLLLQYLIS